MRRTTITNPITNVRSEIRSPLNGRVLGMALDQVVMPGYAAYHLGITAEAQQISASEPQPRDESLQDSEVKPPSPDGDDVTAEDATQPFEEVIDLD